MLRLNFILFFVLIFWSCSSGKKSESESNVDTNDIHLFDPSILQNTQYDEGSDSFYINNNTEFKVVELPHYTEKGKKRNINDEHFYIGESKIFITCNDECVLHIPGHNIILKKDRAIIKGGASSYDKVLPGSFQPKAFVNRMYNNKYKRIGSGFASNIFGNMSLKVTGMACDDSDQT